MLGVGAVPGEAAPTAQPGPRRALNASRDGLRVIGRMVAADAFSHALTNLLLDPAVFNERTFSPQGTMHPAPPLGKNILLQPLQRNEDAASTPIFAEHCS